MFNQKGFIKIVLIIAIIVSLAIAYLFYGIRPDNDDKKESVINIGRENAQNKSKLLSEIPENIDFDDVYFSHNNEHFAYVNKDFVVIDNKKEKNYDYIDYFDYFDFFGESNGHVYTADNDNNKDFIIFNGNEIAVNPGNNNTSFLTGFPVISSDGKQIAYVLHENDEDFVVLNGNRGNGYRNISGMFFSPDNKHFAFEAEKKEKDDNISQIMVIDGKEGASYDFVDGFNFSSDGKQYVYAARKNKKSFLIVNGEEKQTDYNNILRPKFTSNSNLLFYIGETSEGTFLIVNDKEISQHSNIYSPVFSDNEKKIAYHAENGKEKFMVVYDIKNGQENKINNSSFMAFSPNNKFLARSVETKDSDSIVVEPVDGDGEKIYQSNFYEESCSEEMGGCLYGIGDLIFSPDSKHFAYVIETKDKKSFIVLDGNDGKIYDKIDNMRFSSDSKYLIYNAVNGRELWKIVESVGEKSSEEIDENYFTDKTDNLNTKPNKFTEIKPKDYSLLNYPLKESPIYDQLSDYCYKPENEEEIIQKDTRLVKNSGEIVIPSIRQLIFASENAEPNCVTEIDLFSAPTDGKYLYLTVSKLISKEHMNWPVYRLDLLNLSVEKILYVSVGGSINTEEGFISNENKLLPDGKRVVRWNDKDVFLINMETYSSSIIYTAQNNQWLVSNVNPIDVIGKFLDTDVKVNGNQVTIGVYDQNQTFTKNSPGYQDYDINYVLVNRITISIPNNQ